MHLFTYHYRAQCIIIEWISNVYIFSTYIIIINIAFCVATVNFSTFSCRFLWKCPIFEISCYFHEWTTNNETDSKNLTCPTTINQWFSEKPADIFLHCILLLKMIYRKKVDIFSLFFTFTSGKTLQKLKIEIYLEFNKNI